MSANPHLASDAAHAHAHHDGDEPAHGSRRSYLIGFVLSVLLTAAPFALVMTGVLPVQATGLLIAAMAAVQVVVHMVFFLHMSAKLEGGWSLMALIFTLIVVFIALTGTLWVMYHLNQAMMPMTHMDPM
jgi:cytochrome o ubiquinol oxidase operon protein cyoD